MSKADERRLDRIEGALAPREAALLWLDEAHAFGSFRAYVASLQGQSDGAWPLFKLTTLVEDSTRRMLKGQPRESTERAVRTAVRDVAFLVYLVLQATRKVEHERRAWSLQLLLLIEWTQSALRTGDPWEGERANRFQAMAVGLACDVFLYAEAIDVLARRYFAGRTPLFPEMAEELRTQVTLTEQAITHHNDCLEFGLLKPSKKRGSRGGAAAGQLDLASLQKQMRTPAQEFAGYLTDMAKADALLMMDQRDDAFRLMERRFAR